ncbi:MAG: HEAT repeat domain-containing protein [Candidatus Binatia bacterium]
MKRFAWIFALAAGVASAETPSPYRVTIDVGPAIAALGSEDLFESDPAQDRLQALGPAALPALRAALAREPASVRTGVVEVLSHLGADGLPALLGVATHDPDPEVRHDAIIDLGVAKDPRGRPVVERLLKHDDARDRLAAVQACATLCATPGALRRLVRIAIEDPSMATGMAARRSLGTITASAGNRRAAVVATIARAAVPPSPAPRRSPSARGRRSSPPTSATRPAPPHTARPRSGVRTRTCV